MRKKLRKYKKSKSIKIKKSNLKLPFHLKYYTKAITLFLAKPLNYFERPISGHPICGNIRYSDIFVSEY